MKRDEMAQNSSEKMDLRSMDVGADNRARLKALFPSVFTETQNEKGEPIEFIDFEKLKAELGTFSDLFEARRETETRKIGCGRAHFDALGVNFEVATNIHEVLAK
jgi:hypothetical protein